MKNFVAATVAIACFAGATFAQDITSVNGYQFQARIFNDFGTTNLTYGPAGNPINPAPVPGNYPMAGFNTGVEILEQFPQGAAGNFANKHQALFSNDGGATAFGVSNFQSFSITSTVSVTAPAGGPRKEAGIVFYNDRGNGWIDEGRLLVAGENGEVAMFGANMNFFSFGAGTYTPGTTATMTYNYFAPGTAGTPNAGVAAYSVTFVDAVNGVFNSGMISFDLGGAVGPNSANGFNSGSTLGFIAQNQRNPFIADSSDIVYGNVSVVPSPASAALLGLAGLVARRRRR